MVFGVALFADVGNRRATKSGFYLTVSDNGIDWDPPVRLWTVLPLPVGDAEIVCHPALVLEDVKQRDGSVQGELFYAYSPKFGPVTHHLASRSVRIGKAAGN